MELSSNGFAAIQSVAIGELGGMVRVSTWDSIDQHVGIDQVCLHSSTIAIEAAEPSSAASIDPHYYDI